MTYENSHVPVETPAAPWPTGTRLRVVAPIRAMLLTHWRAPYTGGREVLLSEPLVLVVDHRTDENASLVYCRPQPYDAFQRRHVPWWERWRPDYGGLSLLVESSALRECTVAADSQI